MRRFTAMWLALRRRVMSWRSLQTRLTFLYAGLFCACVAVLGTAAVIFKPDFLIRDGSHSDPEAPSGLAPGCPRVVTPAHPCFTTGTRNWTGGAIMITIVILLAIAAGWLIAGRVLQPLRGIIASARAISASNLNERLALDGPDDEFRELGRTLDDLFGRLEASFASQRHFVANASHELRTPLAAERTLIQVALADPSANVGTLRSACEQVLALNDQQERLIEGLLTLATSERGVSEWESVDLCEVAARVVAARRPEAERQGLEVAAALATARASGNPSLVESLVANLVDNALRHNVPDGRVEIATEMTAGRATISVGNTGTVIPPDEIERLAQPFQKLGRERVLPAGGYGLGLAIVYAIARAHHARLAARVRPGGGLDIEVSFPDAAGGGAGTIVTV